MRQIFTKSAFLIILLALAGCGREEVTSYRVPKERTESKAAATPEAPQSMANTSMNPQLANQAAGIKGASWTAPAHWEETAGSAMRKGTFRIDASTELAITAFPGDVGGLLANVNRWLNQIGGNPVTMERLQETAETREVGGYPTTVVFLQSTNPGANGVLGAIVSLPEATWFFKVTGPLSTLEAERANFDGFLDTVSFNGS